MKPSLMLSIDLNRTSDEFKKHLKRMSEQQKQTTYSSSAIDYSLYNTDEVRTVKSLINNTVQRVIEINNTSEVDDKTKEADKTNKANIPVQPSQDFNQEIPIALASSSQCKQIYMEPYCDIDKDITIRQKLPLPAIPRKIKYSHSTSDQNMLMYKVNKETQTDNILNGNESINEIKNFLQANGMSRNAMQSLFAIDNNNNHNNDNNLQAEQDLYNRSNRITEELRQEIIKKSDENKKALLINNAPLIALAQQRLNLNISDCRSDQKRVTPNQFSVNTEMNNTVATNVNMSAMLVGETLDSVRASGFKRQNQLLTINRDQSRMVTQLKLYRQQPYQSHHENPLAWHNMPRTSRDPRSLAPRASQNMQPAMHYADNYYGKMRAVNADHSSSLTSYTTAAVPELNETNRPNYAPGFLYPVLPPWFPVSHRQDHQYVEEQEETQRVNREHGHAQDQSHQQDLMYKQVEKWQYQNRYLK